MFICTECGEIFSVPDRWEERHGLDYGPFEQISGCPRCGGSYTNAHKCDCCHKYIDDRYIKLESGDRICSNCYMTYEIGDEDYD